MPRMTKQQTHEFLTTGGRVLRLATLTGEGSPYVNPVWFRYDGEAFLLMGRRKARWVDNIRNDRRVSACIDTPDMPYVRVLFEGTAEIVDPNWVSDWEEWALEYMDPEVGHRYYEETKQIPRALIKITPGAMTTWAGPGWHPRYHEEHESDWQ